MQGKTILIIDDDTALCRSIDLLLSKEKAVIVTAFDGKEGLKLFFERRPDLVIIDIMMPLMDGYEVCRQIRLLAPTPIILLTTVRDDSAIVKGLDAGADDFVSKPFNGKVLIARIRAVLRRAALSPLETTVPHYRDEHLFIEPLKRQVSVNGQEIKLSAREFDLLVYLYTNADLVLTYNQILERLWGWEYSENIDYVHVYISRLRRKIEVDSREPQYLLTEHGIGYRFKKVEA